MKFYCVFSCDNLRVLNKKIVCNGDVECSTEKLPLAVSQRDLYLSWLLLVRSYLFVHSLKVYPR